MASESDPSAGRGPRSARDGLVADAASSAVAAGALGSHEETCRALFDSNPQPMWVFDLETLRILAVNDAAVARYGYTRGEFLAMTLRDLHPREDLPRLERHLANSRPGYAESRGWRHLLRDGSAIDVEIRAHGVVFDGRPATFVMIQDLTDRRQIEDALRRSEERLRTILAAEPECVKVLAPDGSLLEMNPAGLAMLEAASLEDARRKPLIEYVAAAHRSGFHALFQRVMHGESGTLVFELEGLHGARRWLDTHAVPLRAPDGSIVGLLGVTRDVTVHHRAQEALRESEERFRALIERSSDLLTVFDRNGRVRFASPSVSEVLGHPPRDLFERNPLDLVHPDDFDEARTVLARLMREPGATARIVTRVRHSDGTWRTLESVGRSLVNVPAVEGVVVNSRDITEQRQLEEQLRHAQRLESIGRLAGGVAHDFNNLLTVILGHGELLAARLAGSPDALDDLGGIRDAAQQASALTRQLLAFARRQVLQPTVLDVNEVVRESDRFLRHILGANVRLELRLGERLWPVLADPQQIGQVIVNLALNARDAMPGGGRLVLSTSNVEVEGAVPGWHDGPAPSGPHVLLEVVDDGAGIAHDVLEHIFEPFFTTKQFGSGTGLGLATVHGIVQQSGGHITVESEPGRGTHFRLYFPRSAEPLAAAPEAEPAGSRTGTETVLLVEDHEPVRQFIAQTLRGAGYDVIVAEDGRQALALSASVPQEIALLVTDLLMPGLPGDQVAAELRLRAPALRTLFISGYSEEFVKSSRPALHDAGFLAKPFSAETLLRRVRDLLDAAAPAGD